MELNPTENVSAAQISEEIRRKYLDGKHVIDSSNQQGFIDVKDFFVITKTKLNIFQSLLHLALLRSVILVSIVHIAGGFRANSTIDRGNASICLQILVQGRLLLIAVVYE